MPGVALLSPLLSRLTLRLFSQYQPKTSAGKTAVTKHRFTVDYSKPAADGVFDGADFEKFLHDRIKVDGKAGQLGDSVKISRDGIVFSLLINLLLQDNFYRQHENHRNIKHSLLQKIPQISYQKVFEEEQSPGLDSVCLAFTPPLPYFYTLLSVVASAKDNYQLRFYNIACVFPLDLDRLLNSPQYHRWWGGVKIHVWYHHIITCYSVHYPIH